jgi:hypothetical protein
MKMDAATYFQVFVDCVCCKVLSQSLERKSIAWTMGDVIQLFLHTLGADSGEPYNGHDRRANAP